MFYTITTCLQDVSQTLHLWRKVNCFIIWKETSWRKRHQIVINPKESKPNLQKKKKKEICLYQQRIITGSLREEQREMLLLLKKEIFLQQMLVKWKTRYILIIQEKVIWTGASTEFPSTEICYGIPISDTIMDQSCLGDLILSRKDQTFTAKVLPWLMK